MVAKRVDEVVNKYGSLKGWELERMVKERLGLLVEGKLEDYMGFRVDDYLREEGFKLVTKDLAHG
ncbi:hypothetical protein [Vulcanisaeta distributa]|uniref:hypothetical protein n=1 Tax=Vulcanisaeta distributa TaxID=164451 RepID=UPI000B318620|nr:hypothetical protein [Vulcanisaeta distributa]